MADVEDSSSSSITKPFKKETYMSVYYTFHCSACKKEAPLLTRNSALPLKNFETSNFTNANKSAFLIRDCDESTFEEMLAFVEKHKNHKFPNGNVALSIINDEGAPANF